MPSIDINADAAQGVNELGRYGNALDSVTSRIDKLNSVTAEFNKKGDLVGATVKSQTGAFETLTQSVNKAGVVVASFYTKNEEAARRAAERIQAAQDRADQRAADALAKKFAKEEVARNKAIDKEIADRAKAASKEPPKPPKGIVGAFDDAVSGILRTGLRLATFRAFSFITSEIQDSVSAAKDFQVQLSLIRTIQQGPGEQQSFAKTGRDVRGVSDATGFNIKDVGKAFYDATSNQVSKGAGTAEFVKQAADFARVTGSDLPSSVNLLSTAINSYGLSAADAEKISAIFFKTIDEGRVVASEMANTLGRLYPLASQVGVSMTEVNSVIAITTQKGVKTSDAITLMSNLLLKLEKPTAETSEFFKSLGVNSGEAAINLYGFTGLLQKMVDAVNTGKVPVSAFFDEIRGRKQFAVFQQSIGQIDEFNKKLQNTQQVVSEYRTAQVIRGESPGDALAREANKLKNVFQVDLGQAILENLNVINKWVGGVDGISNTVGGFKNILISGSIALGGYTVVQLIAARGNLALAASFKAVGVAINTAFVPLAVATVAIGTYITARAKLFGGGTKDRFGTADLTQVDSSVDALERYKAGLAGIKKADNPFVAFDKQKSAIDDTFRSAIGLIAGANVANNKFLDEAKQKSKDVADSVKISFAGITDTIKSRIGEIKKGISDANEEIKRSKKSTEKFGDTAADALFSFRSKYANDDLGGQKILLTQQKIADISKRIQEEEKKGTEEGYAEARRLFQEKIKEQVALEELRVTQGEKAFQRDLEQHPEAHAFPGGNIYSVDDTNLSRELAKTAKEHAEFEERVQKSKESQVDSGKNLLGTAEAQLRTLEQALKQYESIDLYNKQGDLKGEYKTQGRFDPSKLKEDLDKAQLSVLASVGNDPTAQLQVLNLFAQRRAALNTEAGAQERAENLKTYEARLQTEKDTYTKRVDDLKKTRTELEQAQAEQFTNFTQKFEGLRGFANVIAGAGSGPGKPSDLFNRKPSELFDSKEEAQYRKIVDAINEYQQALIRLRDTKIKRGDVEALDPTALNDARSSYRNAIQVLEQAREKFGNRAGNVEIQDSSGRKFNLADALPSFDQSVKEASGTSTKLLSNKTDLDVAGKEFQSKVGGPIKDLQAQFPELATQGSKSLDELNTSFKNLANGGVEDLRKQLSEVQSLIPKVGGQPGADKARGRTGFLDGGDDTGAGVYAATGGIVGQFPGQPRGVDRYPIWAAKGEYIIPADISATYAPMLNAIMQRRAPQYMAEGGQVGGGTTNIGDINISVHGAMTNTETARVIGNRLERQLRQNNIKLNGNSS